MVLPDKDGLIKHGSEQHRQYEASALAPALCLLLFITFATNCFAQGSGPGVIYSKQRLFRIPFETESGERRLREVRLFYSEDQGRTWRPYATAWPADRGFNFQTERDGMYWFTVQTIDTEFRAFPANVQGVPPQLKVYVDTQPPEINLRPALSRDGTVGVEWDIRDENLDLASFSLEYHVAGNDWIPLRVVNPLARGDYFWNSGTSGMVEVRLRVRDLAKNESEGKLTLVPGNYGTRAWSTSNDAAGQANRPLAGTRHVNSRRISLDYEIEEQGPSGVSSVELYATRDGSRWEKVRAEANPRPPFVFDVENEGIYGFTIIVRSGVGTPSDREPQAGDQPQIWVEVDLTKPRVEWVKAEAEAVPQNNTNRVTITWSATDKNLGRECITLKYSKEPQGPWTEIATKLENTGRYVWAMPAGAPWSFFVRVEATDKAGNVGFNETPQTVKVDLVKPKSRIRDVQPVVTPIGANPDPPNRE